MSIRSTYGFIGITVITIALAVLVNPVSAVTIEHTPLVICRNTDRPIGNVYVKECAEPLEDYLLVEFKIEGDYASSWEFVSTYLAVEEDKDDIPTKWYGAPKVRDFEYNKNSDELHVNTATIVNYLIPYVEDGDHDWEEDDTIYVSACAVVKNTAWEGCWNIRVAWGYGTSFTRWSGGMYFTATIEGVHM